VSGLTLDSGALIALDRNNRSVIALLERARADLTHLDGSVRLIEL